jgi:ribosome-associated protein
LATTKRSTGTKRARNGSSTSDTRTERPRLQSSHGARSYAAKKAHAVARPDARKRAAKTVAASAGPRTKKARASSTLSSGASVASDEARECAVAIAIAALDKKALGLEILDVAGKVDYADFLVLMTGRSDRQVAALAQGIQEALQKKNRRALSVEGLQNASWVLMDFGDVVVHVFQDDARSLYDIEGLWLDARRLPVPLPESLR